MYPLTFYPLLGSLLRTACFSLLVLKFLFFTPHLCRPSNNHSGLQEQQCRMKEQHVCAGTEGQWHTRVCEIRLLSWQSALTIFISTHICVCVCVYKNTVVFIYMLVGLFFYLQKKCNSWNLFSLNWSAAQISVLERWWSGWMNLSSSNDLLQ